MNGYQGIGYAALVMAVLLLVLDFSLILGIASPALLKGVSVTVLTIMVVVSFVVAAMFSSMADSYP